MTIRIDRHKTDREYKKRKWEDREMKRMMIGEIDREKAREKERERERERKREREGEIERKRESVRER